MQITEPTVSTGHNGSGAAVSSSTWYDEMGRAIWYKDADGFIGYAAYDDSTGAVVKTIKDVNYSELSTPEQDLFDDTGWTPPSSGLHLATTYMVDDRGRTVKQTDPSGRVTYTAYRVDRDQTTGCVLSEETRTYHGWDSVAHQPTGPVEVERKDLTHGYTESLRFSWDDSAGLPVDASGAPAGSEDLTDSRAHIQSLVRNGSIPGDRIHL